MAWGLWSDVGMGSELGELDMRRMTGTASLRTISAEEGLLLFAHALTSEEAVVFPVCMDRAALRTEARAGELPCLMRGLAGSRTRKGPVPPSAVAQQLVGKSARQLTSLVEDLVRTEVACVLGYTSPQEVDPRAALKDLGFDSLAAVELRNRLSPQVGLALPATLVFDYPSCAALTRYLLDELADKRSAARPVDVGVVNADEPIAIVGIGCRYPGECDRQKISGGCL